MNKTAISGERSSQVLSSLGKFRSASRYSAKRVDRYEQRKDSRESVIRKRNRTSRIDRGKNLIANEGSLRSLWCVAATFSTFSFCHVRGISP
jgi:hypothetical protein